MLPLLDRLLARILVEGVRGLANNAGIVSDTQVNFLPPDATFRNQTPTGPRLSIHLVDLRENLKLRANDRLETQVGTTVTTRRLPYRLDCHYLISAHATPEPTKPPLQHTLLYQTTQALVQSQPLVPARFYPPGSVDLAPWGDYQDIELPMIVNPHEGFPKLAEFWGTLEGTHPWHPVVYVVVTLPIERVDTAGIEIVRRRTTTYQVGVATDVFVEIGGVVLDKAGSPVGRAQVTAGNVVGGATRVELARTTSEDDGTFILKLPATATHIWAAAFGLGITTALDVSTTSPTPATDFTLRFT
jgi:hypothetical protein